MEALLSTISSARFISTVLGLVIFSVGTTNAAILLGEKGGIQFGSTDGQAPLESVKFMFHYGYPFIDTGACVGCFDVFPLATGSGGTSISKDFTGLAVPATFRTQLTDGVTQEIAISVHLTQSGITGGGISGFPDTKVFPTANTWDLAFVRLEALFSGDNPGRYSVEYNWQFWGTGTPTPPPVVVPQPETVALMLTGLGLLGLVARRRKQKAA